MRIRIPSNPVSILMMYVRAYARTYVRTYVSVTLRNIANQRSNVIIIARKEGGAWERIIINAPQAIDRGEG